MITLSEFERPPLRHVSLYLVAWLGYFGLLILLPVDYGRLQAGVASASLIAWVMLSAATACVVHYGFVRRGMLARGAAQWFGQPLQLRDLRRLIILALVLSCVGFICLLYDRLVIQGIDFSQGIAIARELWGRAGEGRDGVSSAFSVLGYLFGFTFFVATTLAHLHWESLSARLRRQVILWPVLLVLGHSLLTGGRSIVLVQLACIVATGAIRSQLGRPMLPGRGVRIGLFVAFGLLLSIGYSIYVFSARADASGELPERYAQGMLRYLGGEPSDGFYALTELPLPLAGTAQFATVAGAYLSHSYGTFESVLNMPFTPGRASFGLLGNLLAKVGVTAPLNEEWVLSGRFLSLPGALWYDFGWFGFYLGALVVGAAIGTLPFLVATRGGGGIAMCIAIVILVTGLLAPLLIALDVMCLPFLVVGFGLIHVLHWAWAGPTNWMVVSRPVRRAYTEDIY